MYDYLDLRQTERLKELVPYKALAPDADEIIKELNRLNNIINELEKDLCEVRQLTFTKYNSNEWNNCLSFNDDIKPILDKIKALKENNKE